MPAWVPKGDKKEQTKNVIEKGFQDGEYDGEDFWCKACVEHPFKRSAQNGLDLGETYPEIGALTDVEAMLLARVHPIVQVYTQHRTGQTIYAGHVAN